MLKGNANDCGGGGNANDCGTWYILDKQIKQKNWFGLKIIIDKNTSLFTCMALQKMIVGVDFILFIFKFFKDILIKIN